MGGRSLRLLLVGCTLIGVAYWGYGFAVAAHMRTLAPEIGLLYWDHPSTLSYPGTPVVRYGIVPGVITIEPMDDPDGFLTRVVNRALDKTHWAGFLYRVEIRK